MRTGCHYFISLSVCVTFVVFADCESCTNTRPISTNPGSMEASKYGLTRGTCFVARRLEVVAVAGCCGFRIVFWVRRDFVFFFRFCFFERTRSAASMTPPCLIYLSTSNEARPKGRSDRGRFSPLGEKTSSYRGAYRVPLFN